MEFKLHRESSSGLFTKKALLSLFLFRQLKELIFSFGFHYFVFKDKIQLAVNRFRLNEFVTYSTYGNASLAHVCKVKRLYA